MNVKPKEKAATGHQFAAVLNAAHNLLFSCYLIEPKKHLEARHTKDAVEMWLRMMIEEFAENPLLLHDDCFEDEGVREEMLSSICHVSLALDDLAAGLSLNKPKAIKKIREAGNAPVDLIDCI